MRKLNLNYNVSSVEDYIKEIQAKLPQYEINVNNVNDFSLMLEERANCLNCCSLNSCANNQKGYYTEYKDGQFSSVECKYKREYRIQNNKEALIKTLYLPAKILSADLADYHTNTESRKKIYSFITEFVQGFRNKSSNKGLYIYGTFSIGKTYTLACVANELARNDIECLLIYFPDLVVDLKNALGTPRFEQLINMLKSVDVLMLDDLGSENVTPWLRDEILGPVLNYRALEGKPLFVSSNINPSDLKNHYAIDKAPQSVLKAERVVSRLQALVNSISMDDTSKYKR